MREIPIPEPVTITATVQEDGKMVQKGNDLAFCDFLKQALDGNQEFNKGAAGARQYAKLMDIVEKINGEDASITVDDADYEALKRSIDALVVVSPKVNRVLIPFYDAVENAESPPALTEKKKDGK